MGTELPWRWGRGTISANLDVIWGMSVETYKILSPKKRESFLIFLT